MKLFQNVSLASHVASGENPYSNVVLSILSSLTVIFTVSDCNGQTSTSSLKLSTGLIVSIIRFGDGV